jgi:hypothetical protein
LTLKVSVKRLDNYISNLEVTLNNNDDDRKWTRTTNGQGVAQFSGLSPGSYFVKLGGEYTAYTFGSINLLEQQGPVISFVVPAITTDILILEPLPETPVSAEPYLGWAAYPGATKYTVYVWQQPNKSGGWEIWEVFHTEKTYVVVNRALEYGHNYAWTVYSYYGANDETMLATSGFGPTFQLNWD